MTAHTDSPIDPYQDQRERYRPSPKAVTTALAALKAEPAAEAVVVPMWQPGKSYGIWRVGQVVASIELEGDDVLLAYPPHGCGPTIRDQQDKAYELAGAELAKHGAGTTSYAVVRPEGTWAVFEEILSAR